jgi:hypothetical protein
MVEYASRSKRVMIVAVAASLGLAGAAHAQATSAVAASNAAYRAQLAQQQLNSDAARDSNGAPISTDGVTQAGEDQSGLIRDGDDGGAFDTLSGVGGSGAVSGISNLAVVTRAEPSTTTNTVRAEKAASGDANHDQ